MFPGAVAVWAVTPGLLGRLCPRWHTAGQQMLNETITCLDSHFIFQKLGNPKSPVNKLKVTQNECVTTLGPVSKLMHIY